MARKIVILAQREGPGKDTEIAVAFWLDVTVVSRRPFYAEPEATSAVPDATQGETDAIRAGVVVERVNRYARTAGTTNTQIKTYLEARYAEEQAALSADGTYRFAGTTWDGATWTNVVND
jgi:hypothetical protein